MARANAKGRGKDARHVRVYQSMLSSPAWLATSGNAIKALIYLASYENGENNGDLFMGTRQLATGIGVTKKTAGKLLKELQDHGFVVPTALGFFSIKDAQTATCWRLTWLAWKGKMGPSNEWKSWTPGVKNTGVKTTPGAGVIITPRLHDETETGVTFTPAFVEKPQKPVRLGRVISTPHTVTSGSLIGAGSGRPGSADERGKSNPGDPLKSGGIFAVADRDGSEPLPNCNVTPFQTAGTCERCEEPFQSAGRGKPKRYCSEACRKAAEGLRRYRRLKGEAA